ncbi:DUF6114 domain-containing protein [Actinacidiphila soli]|jgi:hypothetical protein|uniref:DUF6114 domain-containing protein n=1 Tax=Actinacidiphila soli TaxID=2487275 RepID=UPI001F0C2693|nr:DUF6114 domain-containing protein [Actinacidiphila soli]
MSAETQGRVGYWRFRFRVWRGQRPFWAGLLTILAGGPIAYFPYAHLSLGGLTLAMATTAGAGSLIIGVLLVVLGLTMWYQAVARVFAGVASIMLALVSLVVSNIGGFLMGFLLGLIGGALAVAWVPADPAAEPGADPAELPDGGDADGGGQGEYVETDAYAHEYEHDHAVEANGRHSAG